MGVEPALTAAVGGGLVDVEPILDVLPIPLILVEPGTARMLYANAAAHRMAGGALTLGVAAEDYPSAYRLFDASGAAAAHRRDAGRAGRARRDAQPRPGRLGDARGHVPPSSSPGTTITLAGGRRIAVVTFEDVTELESSRRRASLLADELRVMLDGVADAITVQSPDYRVIYANEAASRALRDSARPRPRRLLGRRSTCSGSRCWTRRARRWS